MNRWVQQGKKGTASKVRTAFIRSLHREIRGWKKTTGDQVLPTPPPAGKGRVGGAHVRAYAPRVGVADWGKSASRKIEGGDFYIGERSLSS